MKAVLIVTGPPRSGKTTLVENVISQTKMGAKGFVTREVRDGKERTGFKVVMDDGRWAVLADVSAEPGPRVGKYRVNLRAIEDTMIRFFETAAEAPLYYVDEIGKMEMTHSGFASAFEKFVRTRAGKLIVVVGSAYLKWTRSVCSNPTIVDLGKMAFEEGLRRVSGWISDKMKV